jgi:hypothetical protein
MPRAGSHGYDDVETSRGLEYTPHVVEEIDAFLTSGDVFKNMGSAHHVYAVVRSGDTGLDSPAPLPDAVNRVEIGVSVVELGSAAYFDLHFALAFTRATEASRRAATATIETSTRVFVVACAASETSSTTCLVLVNGFIEIL